MSDRLRRLLNLRYRISVQLYAALGAAVALTFAASLVGIFSFNRMGDIQSRVTEGSVPELDAAFGVARYSSTLVAAGPRLTSAVTGASGVEEGAPNGSAQGEELEEVSRIIGEAHLGLQNELSTLEELAGDNPRLPAIRQANNTLIENLNRITEDQEKLIELEKSTQQLRNDLAEVREKFDHVVVPQIDDQFFYAMTGYRELGRPAVARSQHLSEEEFGRYRYLAEIQADGNLAAQLLASAFTISDPAAIEPFREEFESAHGRIAQSLDALGDSSLLSKVEPIYDELFHLGMAQDGGFNLLEEQLSLAQRQSELLAQNRDIGQGLVEEVEVLVKTAEASAEQATQASAQAILTGRTLLLTISAISIAGALLISWLFIGRILLHRLAILSTWMRRMAGGDLESQVELGGQDEIADMADALEVFRQHALEVQRLNLVEELNAQLEETLADLRRAQDQIVSREKLAALGELTAGVAHEIRNPLNFVKNFSESSEDLLDELRETLEESAERLEDEQKALVEDISGELVANLERIRTHGERANRIVQDMLMMGRGSAGFQLTDLNRLLEQNARLAYHSARALDSDFQLDIKENLDPEVGELSVVAQDLGRVFLNMVANACDATADKRRDNAITDIRAWMPTLTLSTHRGEEQIEVRIRDNGNGIPPEAIDKIFNPFFTTKPTDKGTGLGLAICTDIVRQHGGHIRVDTEPGEFTEMIIELPLNPDAVEELEGSTAPVAEPV